MKVVEFDNGVVQVDAAVIAEGLGIAVPLAGSPAEELGV
jgi:hypothetical protein